VQQQIEATYRPFEAMLQALRPVFPRLMVHGLPPRTPDDAKAARWTGGVTVAAAVRSKMTVLANRRLAGICAALDIPFLDTWAETSLDGYLHPDFELDGLHLNQRATAVSLSAIAAALYDHTAPTHNPFRYQLLRIAAPPYDGPRDEAAERDWSARGIAIGRLNPADTRRWASGLSFDAGAANPAAHPHWVGYPRGGRPGVATARLSSERLEAAAASLGSPAARRLFQAGEAMDYGQVFLRPIALDPGQAAAADLPTPLECRRALVCLDDGGAVELETTEGAAIQTLAAREGLLVVYDPRRVRCRARAEASVARFAEIGLAHRPASHPFRVVAPGLCDWPADPFHYTVKDAPAWPPFAHDLVHERSPA